MKRVPPIGLHAASWLSPPGTSAAAFTPTGGHAHGRGERILVDAYYPLLDFSYRLLKALRGFSPPMPRTTPCCLSRHASFRPMRVPLSPPSFASLPCKA